MRLGLLTDIHWAPPQTTGGWHSRYDFAGLPDRLAAAFAHFAAERVELISLTGDLTHLGDDDATRAIVARCAALTPAPIVAVTGNHDVSADAGRLARAITAVGAERFALAAPAATRPLGPALLAGVQLAQGDGWFGSRLAAHPDPAGWADRPVVLLSHLPVLSAATAIATHGLPYPGDLLDREPLEAALTARPGPTIVLSGHIHARTARARGPVLQLTQGALIEAPFECATVDVVADAAGLRVERRAVSLQASDVARPPVLCAARTAWRFAADDARWTAAVPRPAGPPLRPQPVPI